MNAPTSPRALAVVALGGALGSVGRYGLSRAFPVAPATFPTTTFLINVGGAFVLAVVLETLVRHDAADHWVRAFVGVGALGAFTTFSTLATEIATLWRDGDRGLAVGYGIASILAGTAAVVAGLLVAGYRRPPVPPEGES